MEVGTWFFCGTLFKWGGGGAGKQPLQKLKITGPYDAPEFSAYNGKKEYVEKVCEIVLLWLL